MQVAEFDITGSCTCSKPTSYTRCWAIVPPLLSMIQRTYKWTWVPTPIIRFNDRKLINRKYQHNKSSVSAPFTDPDERDLVAKIFRSAWDLFRSGVCGTERGRLAKTKSRWNFPSHARFHIRIVAG